MFRVYVQKHSGLSWMSTGLLLRKLRSDTVVVWYQSLEDDVWFV